jgi:hypothetical protein
MEYFGWDWKLARENGWDGLGVEKIRSGLVGGWTDVTVMIEKRLLVQLVIHDR